MLYNQFSHYKKIKLFMVFVFFLPFCHKVQCWHYKCRNTLSEVHTIGYSADTSGTKILLEVLDSSLPSQTWCLQFHHAETLLRRLGLCHLPKFLTVFWLSILFLGWNLGCYASIQRQSQKMQAWESFPLIYLWLRSKAFIFAIQFHRLPCASLSPPVTRCLIVLNLPRIVAFLYKQKQL